MMVRLVHAMVVTRDMKYSVGLHLSSAQPSVCLLNNLLSVLHSSNYVCVHFTNFISQAQLAAPAHTDSDSTVYLSSALASTDQTTHVDLPRRHAPVDIGLTSEQCNGQSHPLTTPVYIWEQDSYTYLQFKFQELSGRKRVIFREFFTNCTCKILLVCCTLS